MTAAASNSSTPNWLLEHGPKQLELLFQATVYYATEPILIADNDRHSRDASSGATMLLGLSREKIRGRSLDDFIEPSFRLRISELWNTFLQIGEQEGTIPLLGSDGRPREVEYTAKGNVLPVRHLLLLRAGKASPARTQQAEPSPSSSAWVKDYAMFLIDVDGRVAAWYGGAERIYGYSAPEIVNQPVALLYPPEENAMNGLREELKRSAIEGHFGSECWCLKKDGTRFWGNVVTTSLRDEGGALQGFASVVRDFSARHERDRRFSQRRAGVRSGLAEAMIPGIVSGEFDRTPDANDAFLEMVGYSREDLLAGRLHWPELTPAEYLPREEVAHEEGLRFGACTPYEKELIRKDGTRIPVFVATAVLGLSPFHWITFVQDLRERDRQERVEDAPVEVKNDFAEIIGRSSALKRTLALIELVAPTNATVLILGETGTGKELVARAIHRISFRRDRPFITLNCSAIPTGLLESELFGYERGAFTGALSQKIGRFEMAHQGTLFLDEVGDIPLDLQPKLLRALQEKAFERLGGTRTIPIDIRLLAATNRNLTQMMRDKLFRSDLYYRLKVFPITTPPLRDHPEDIPTLSRHFMHKYSREMNKEIVSIPSETMRALANWSWPGNVRELENFIERSVILSQGHRLRAPLDEIRLSDPRGESDSTLEHVEREHIVRVLREVDGVVSKAAARLGVPRTTLHALMRKLGIVRHRTMTQRQNGG